MIVEIVALLLGFLALMSLMGHISNILRRRHELKIAQIDPELAKCYVNDRKGSEDWND